MSLERQEVTNDKKGFLSHLPHPFRKGIVYTRLALATLAAGGLGTAFLCGGAEDGSMVAHADWRAVSGNRGLELSTNPTSLRWQAEPGERYQILKLRANQLQVIPDPRLAVSMNSYQEYQPILGPTFFMVHGVKTDGSTVDSDILGVVPAHSSKNAPEGVDISSDGRGRLTLKFNRQDDVNYGLVVLGRKGLELVPDKASSINYSADGLTCADLLALQRDAVVGNSDWFCGLSALKKSPESPTPTATATPEIPSGMVPIPGNTLDVVRQGQAKLVAEDPESERNQEIDLTFTLERDDEVGFQKYLASLNQTSAVNRVFLTPQQQADRFGPSQQEYDELIKYFKARGFVLDLDGISANRLTVSFRTTRGNAEIALEVRINDYLLGNRAFYANGDDPKIIASLAPHVKTVTGLNNLSVTHR